MTDDAIATPTPDQTTDSIVGSIFGAFAAAGMVQPAIYTPAATPANPSPASYACNVLMAYGAQSFGDSAPNYASLITATFQLAEVIPARGGVLVLATAHRIYGDTYTCDSTDALLQTASDSRWVMLRGPG